MKLFLCLVAFALIAYSEGSTPETMLIRMLLATYDKLARPVTNESDTVILNVGLKVRIFEPFVEPNKMNSLIWVDMGWKDQYLQWSPESFDGITHTHLPVNSIWIPDLSLYNSADSRVYIKDSDGKAVVYNDGSVTLVTPFDAKTICNGNRQQTENTCEMTFGCWTYNGLKVDLVVDDDEPDISQYQENPSWQLESSSSVREEKYYTCCPEPYPSIKFIFNFVKRSS